MQKSADPDETVRIVKAVSSGSTLFAILLLAFDWNPLQHWMYSNSKMEEFMSETQAWKGYGVPVFRIKYGVYIENGGPNKYENIGVRTEESSILLNESMLMDIIDRILNPFWFPVAVHLISVYTTSYITSTHNLCFEQK